MIEAVWIAFAFGLGLLFKQVGLPPLIGYLGAGFALSLLGERRQGLRNAPGLIAGRDQRRRVGEIYARRSRLRRKRFARRPGAPWER